MDFVLKDQKPNLVADGFDLLVQEGELEDSDLLSRKLSCIRQRLVASPAYIAQHGAPENLGELRRHQAIVNAPRQVTWGFNAAHGIAFVKVPWRLSVPTTIAVADAARHGLGLALLPEFIADRLTITGSLVVCPP